MLSYVFWESGERGAGVLEPSTLDTGSWNCVFSTEGNWNKVDVACLQAGLRGATGLSVLQKWMLESRGLGVSR